MSTEERDLEEASGRECSVCGLLVWDPAYPEVSVHDGCWDAFIDRIYNEDGP